MIGIGSNDDITLKLGTSTVSKAYWGTQQVYPNVTPPTPSGYETQYFTIEATSAGTLYFDDNTTPFEYSLNDGSTWNTSTTTNTYNLGNGEKILFRCTNPSINSSQGIGHFYASDGQFKVYGNIMSLLYGSNFIGQTTFPYANNDYILSELMYSFTTLTDAENLVLPATTLSDRCYKQMFDSCTALETAPELPATTLAQGCYTSMFIRCSSLVNAPVLTATTLAQSCYGSMFRDCTSLTTTPALPATTLTTQCYENMFRGCTSLTSTTELSSTTLAAHCYDRMFYGCTSLTTTPALPATRLADGCYHYMFYACSSLTTAPQLPATTLANYCYQYMFNGCTSLTSATQLPATRLAQYCYDGMFFSCSSLTTAPVLPATTLAVRCYQSMFAGCTNLNYIKMMATDISANGCLVSWVLNVASTGTFVKNVNATWTTTGNNGIPSGWDVQTASE